MNKTNLQIWIINKSELTFSLSGGPGGQNVNKTNSRVTVHTSINDIPFLSETEKNRVSAKLKNRINSKGQLVVTSAEERNQLRNRERALHRTAELIEKALIIPPKRKKTKPSKSSQRKRLECKKKQSEKKLSRRKLSY